MLKTHAILIIDIVHLRYMVVLRVAQMGIITPELCVEQTAEGRQSRIGMVDVQQCNYGLVVKKMPNIRRQLFATHTLGLGGICTKRY